MPFSAYDADSRHLLSAAFSNAMDSVRKSAGGPLAETEMVYFSKRVVENLIMAFDLGERDPAALKQAGLRDVLVMWRKT